MNGSSHLAELIAIFIDEVDEQLQAAEREIGKLEQSGQANASIQPLFRAIHTLKGSSAAMGFEEMKLVTHEMEYVLDLVRSHRSKVTAAMIDLLHRGLECLKELKEEFVEGNGISIMIGPLIDQLRRYTADTGIQSTNSSDPEAKAKAKAEAEDRSQLIRSRRNMEIMHIAQENEKKGLQVLDVRVRITANCPMKLARGLILRNALQPFGEVLLTYPKFEDSQDESTALDTISFLIVTQAAGSQIQSKLETMLDVIHVKVSSYSREYWSQLLDSTNNGGALPIPSEQYEISDEPIVNIQTIRVDVERLDQLSRLVEELAIEQGRARQIGAVVQERYLSDTAVQEMSLLSIRTLHLIKELQESVLKTRMLPIGQLLNRFPRMVRDLARTLDKEIELIIEGQETELDRTVYEQIGSPLIHLIRNAAGHGIESGEVRNRIHKPAIGLLRISIKDDGYQLVITVEDDGAGMDPQKMKASAVCKGMISQEQANQLSDFEAIQLIFESGFSMASGISDISGRGVGMDIVRNHIEKLNGVIEIETKLGEGTRFIIRIPLKLEL